MCQSLIIDGNPALRDQGDRFGKQEPLGFFHNAPLKRLRRVALAHFDGFLQEDRAVIEIFIHKVDCGARDFRASFKHFLMDVKTVIAFSAEGRDQRRMDVDDLSPVCVDDAGRNGYHKAGQDDQIRLRFP